MDALRIESQTLESYNLTKPELAKQYQFDFESPTLGLKEGVLSRDIIEDVRADASAQDTLVEEFATIEEELQRLRLEIFPLGNKATWPLPVNVKRLILNAQKTFNIDERHSVSTVSPPEIVKKVHHLPSFFLFTNEVNNLINRLVVVPGEDTLSEEAQFNATLLFKIHLRAMLGSKRVVRESPFPPSPPASPSLVCLLSLSLSSSYLSSYT